MRSSSNSEALLTSRLSGPTAVARGVDQREGDVGHGQVGEHDRRAAARGLDLGLDRVRVGLGAAMVDGDGVAKRRGPQR